MANCSMCRREAINATECTASGSTGPTCNRLGVIAVNFLSSEPAFAFSTTTKQAKGRQTVAPDGKCVSNVPCTVIGLDEP